MNDTRQAVLEAIAEGPVSGPELAAQLDISRAAVWKHVEVLREEGFEIDGENEGYVLADVPDYGGPAIEFGLEAPYEIEYHDALPSTNDRARELAREGADRIAVVADEQTGGRGRLDREWASPSGGVWVSLLLRPDRPPSQVPLSTLAAAVATARAAREAGVEAVIKWPNDVLVPVDDEHRKLAGILTEMEGEADRVNWVVVGIGVNVNVDAGDLPPEATSVRDLVGDVDRRVFLQRLLEEFHTLQNDDDEVLSTWRDMSATLGQQVSVETESDTVVGEAVDIEYPGALILETDEGRQRIAAGDCEHLRPA